MTGVATQPEWQPTRRLFTVAEFQRIAEGQVIDEDERVELLNGEIYIMSPIGSRHSACVDRLNHLLWRTVGEAAIVRVQAPIIANDQSQPQPNLALLKPRADFYASGHPTGADILLVIEVSDSTAASDRKLKVPLYATAEIPEMWLIDLFEDRIEVHTQPNHGVYKQMEIHLRGGHFTSASVPQIQLAVEDVLG